jgi:probable HAF family extracellular repeat protein
MPAHPLRALLLAIVSCTVIGLPATVTAQPTVTNDTLVVPLYQVEDLGTLPGDFSSVATAINADGDVVGWSQGPSGTRAFLFTDETGMVALPGPPNRPVAFARAISDTGFVVGTASTGGTDIGHAVRWQAGVPQDLGTLGTGLFSEANGVNDAGVTVGQSYTNGGTVLGTHAFRFDDVSGMVDLTPGADSASAQDINDAGQVAGWRHSRAFRLTGDTFTDLGVPAGFAFSFGFAINASGQVAGHVRSATGSTERIFRYTDGPGMVIIGGVGSFNRAWDINAAGDIVGEGRPVAGLQQGFVFTDTDGMRGLNSLVDPDEGWFIIGARGINDAGQIAAFGSGPPGPRALRLTPVDGPPPPPPPPTPPAAPSSLGGSVVSPTQVRLAWTDTAGNETGFTVERALGRRGFLVVAQVGADVTTYTDTVPKRGTYRYRVRAFNAVGASPWSNTVQLRVR